MKKTRILRFLVTMLLFPICLSGCNDSEGSIPTIPNGESDSKPTSNHEHTFSSSWSCNSFFHWHQSTCGHDVVSGKAAHSFIDVVTSPSYEHNGYTTHTCDICGYSYIDSETDMLIHNHSDEVEYDDTGHWYRCIDEGYEDYKCEYMTHDFTVTILDDSSCYKKGKARLDCRCGYSKVEELDYLEHDWNIWVSNDDATCEHDGTKYHICKTCLFKETVTDSGSALGHMWTLTSSKAATCEIDGWKKYSCDRCGKEKTEIVENYGGHLYEKGCCTKCGEFKYKNYFSTDVDLPHEFIYAYNKTKSKIYTKCVVETMICQFSSDYYEDNLHIYLKFRKTYDSGTLHKVYVRYSLIETVNNEEIKAGTFESESSNPALDMLASTYKIYVSNLKFDGSRNYVLKLSDYFLNS